MNADRWHEIEHLFDGATALPAGERRWFLDQNTAHDPTLAAEVWSLIQAHESRHPLLDAPAASKAAEGGRLKRTLPLNQLT